MRCVRCGHLLITSEAWYGASLDDAERGKYFAVDQHGRVLINASFCNPFEHVLRHTQDQIERACREIALLL